MRGKISFLLAVSFVLSLISFGVDVRAAGFAFINVADTTMAAPTGTFTTFNLRNPSISSGVAAFNANYTGGNGIFIGNGGALIITTIVQSGDIAPIGTFSGFGFNTAASGGAMAFLGIYNADNGIFTSNGGAPITIVKTGDTAPIGTFTNFNFTRDGFSLSSGTTAFSGVFNAGADSGIFTGNGGALTLIAKTGDAAPIGTFETFNYTTHGVSISGGTTAFNGLYNGGSDAGIFTGSGGGLTTIAKTGDPAPVGTFNDFGAPSISGITTAFQGTYSAGTGIFIGNGGSLTTIVKLGDAAPIGTFNSLNAPSISGNTTAFSAFYNGGGDMGIFTGIGGALTTVIKTGDSLFGSTVTSLAFGRFGLDSTGDLAFRYVLSDGRSGVAIAGPTVLSNAPVTSPVLPGTNPTVTIPPASGTTGSITATLSSTATDGDLSAAYNTIDPADVVALASLNAGTVNFATPASANSLQVWDIHYTGALNGPVTLAFNYSDAGLTLAEEQALTIEHFVNGQWVDLHGIVDTNANLITVSTDSFSPFALGEETAIPEPASLALLGAGAMLLLHRRRRSD